VISEREIFIGALQEESPAGQQAYLDQACGGNVELRRRVEGLLRDREKAADFLNSPAPALVGTTEELLGERPGTVIGPYKLLEQIGEGGFGVVFMAEQQQPVRRKVALKVLKPGMDTRQVVARFEAERQALALMDHPNIARVLDGGSTPAGRPYFVLDLVKGLPITDYCDQAQLTPRERLELFVHLCQAVQHAHQKGIIHRDLKPSNVLVTLHDGTPLVKVIDFGIAKALGQQLTDKTLFTGFAQLIGTPLYMSPEQAALSSIDVDTRSDIYSLGVLLYELLTGTTPFDKERLKEIGYDELRRIIREEEPPRPSTRISTLGEASITVSAQRKSDPRRLSQLFRGELDWIVMKALEKDRNRRYESASAFAADVQRYLHDEPVQACPPSAWYRFRKFARRNKTGLAVAGLILFFIAVLGGGGGWVLRDRAARGQRLTAQVETILDEVERLEREQKWPEALAATRRAEAALAGGETDDATRERVRDILHDLEFVARLDRIRQYRAAMVEGKFTNSGAVRDYALAFRDYGVDMESLPKDEAIARLQAKPALAAPIGLALDDWMVMLIAAPDRDDPTLKRLVTVARGIDHDPLRDRLRGMWKERPTPELQAELLELAKSFGVKTQSPATVLALVQSLARAQRAEAAIRVLRDGQYAYPGDFWLNIELGDALHERKDNVGAVRYFSVAVSLHPDSPVAHTNLGSALRNQKKLDEAIACHRKAIALDPKFASAHHNLANALMQKGNVEGAIGEYQTALEINSNSAAAHHGLGFALYNSKKDLEGAIREYRTALEIDPNSASVHSDLGLALKGKGRLDEAIAEYRKALALDPKWAPAHFGLGDALDDQGKLDQAIACYQKAIELDPKDASAHSNLGFALRKQGKLDEAVVSLKKAIELDPKLAPLHVNLGAALAEQGKLDEAIVSYKKAIELDQKSAVAHVNLGLAFWRKGHFRKALEALRQGHELGARASARWVRQCERLVELDGKLPDFLEGKTTPAGPAQRVELAGLCTLKRLNRAAARFYEAAFGAEPKLIARNRYNAACVAALAGCGQGKDTAMLDGKERSRLRRQALDWLRADLEAKSLLLEKDANKAGPYVMGQMQHWLADGDFAGVRGPEALATLPEAERQPWQKLWKDVADLLKRAQEKAAPEKKADAK
jgi:tetratricopeptide (TPR) repeat protein